MYHFFRKLLEERLHYNKGSRERMFTTQESRSCTKDEQRQCLCRRPGNSQPRQDPQDRRLQGKGLNVQGKLRTGRSPGAADTMKTCNVHGTWKTRQLSALRKTVIQKRSRKHSMWYGPAANHLHRSPEGNAIPGLWQTQILCPDTRRWWGGGSKPSYSTITE